MPRANKGGKKKSAAKVTPAAKPAAPAPASKQRLVDVKTLADKFDCTERRVHQLVKDRIIPRDERGSYDLEACCIGYIRYLRELVKKREAPADSPKHRRQVAEALRAETQAKREAMEFSEKIGELIPLQTYRQELQDRILPARGEFLALHRRLADHLDAKQAARVEAEVHAILSKLARGLNGTSTDAEDGPGAGAGSGGEPAGDEPLRERTVGPASTPDTQ